MENNILDDEKINELLAELSKPYIDQINKLKEKKLKQDEEIILLKHASQNLERIIKEKMNKPLLNSIFNRNIKR